MFKGQLEEGGGGAGCPPPASDSVRGFLSGNRFSGWKKFLLKTSTYNLIIWSYLCQNTIAEIVLHVGKGGGGGGGGGPSGNKGQTNNKQTKKNE